MTTTNPYSMIWGGTQNGYIRLDSLSALEQSIHALFGAEPEFEPVSLTPLQRVRMSDGYTPLRRTGSLLDVEMISPAGVSVVVDGLGSVRRFEVAR